jgi:hypothetical protein
MLATDSTIIHKADYETVQLVPKARIDFALFESRVGRDLNSNSAHTKLWPMTPP